jgi:hypothetical protein
MDDVIVYNWPKKRSKIDHWLIDSIARFPSIFPNKSKVLAHALFVCGSGYEWVNGELINTCPSDKELFRYKPMDSMFNIEINQTLDRVKYHSDAILHMWLEFTLEDLSHIDEYSNFMNLPDDLTDEWKQLIGEVFEKIQYCFNVKRLHRGVFDFKQLEADMKEAKKRFTERFGKTNYEKNMEDLLAFLKKEKEENT